MKYQVGITIYNSFEIEANSEEEAEEQVRELDVYKTLDDADYNITYVDKIKDETN
jgi:DNA-dependent RNA polymerase auxiliary subunit epsilon